MDIFLIIFNIILETECNIKLANDVNKRAKTYINRSRASITNRLNTENISFHEKPKAKENSSFLAKETAPKNSKSQKSISYHKSIFLEIGNKPSQKEKKIALHMNFGRDLNKNCSYETDLKINENLTTSIQFKKKNSCNNLKLKREAISSELMKKVAKTITLGRKSDLNMKFEKAFH